MPEQKLIAYKIRIGDLGKGKPIMNNDRFSYLEHEGRKMIKVNVIANIVDKYQLEDRNFLSFTLDDASGQIRVKSFGDDIKKFNSFSQGDTVIIIGSVRSYNNEIYISPDIMKIKDPRFLLVRKLELQAKTSQVSKDEILALKDQIISLLKESDSQGGVDIDSLIMTLHSPPDLINQEVKKLLEGGQAYEPRPGKLRYLG